MSANEIELFPMSNIEDYINMDGFIDNDIASYPVLSNGIVSSPDSEQISPYSSSEDECSWSAIISKHSANEATKQYSSGSINECSSRNTMNQYSSEKLANDHSSESIMDENPLQVIDGPAPEIANIEALALERPLTSSELILYKALLRMEILAEYPEYFRCKQVRPVDPYGTLSEVDRLRYSLRDGFSKYVAAGYPFMPVGLVPITQITKIYNHWARICGEIYGVNNTLMIRTLTDIGYARGTGKADESWLLIGK